MTAVLKRAQKKAESSAGTPVPIDARRCLVTGEMKPRAEMIRFVVGPENAVIPDLSENLPGHGLWVTAEADAVRQAVKKNVFAKERGARPAATLAEDVALLLHKRCLNFLGLAKSAGVAVLGEAQTEAALRANKLALFLHAPDATRVLDNRNSISECDLFSRDDMGAALGYDQIVYAGLMPHGVTKKLILEIKRLGSMTLQRKNEG